MTNETVTKVDDSQSAVNATDAGVQMMAQSASGLWQSLDQYNQSPEFLARAENEFLSSPHSVDSDGSDAEGGVARRDFLKLMGASLAMATASGCIRRPAQTIVPTLKAARDAIPGEPNWYASVWTDGLDSAGVWVKSFDGRPIKMEGNPAHPLTLGGLPARAHAEILSLYDPERLRTPRRNLLNVDRTNLESVSETLEAIDAEMVKALGAGGVAVVMSPTTGPATRALIAEFERATGARVVVASALATGGEGRALGLAEGAAPRLRLDKARYVVSVDCDFLGTYQNPTAQTKGWSKAHKPGPEQARLVAFESMMTVTGLNADDRFRIKPSLHRHVVLGLLHDVGLVRAKSSSISGELAQALKAYSDVSGQLGLSAEQWKEVADGLWAARGSGAVLVGGLAAASDDQDLVFAAAALLNQILGSDVVDLSSRLRGAEAQPADLISLTRAMSEDKIQTVILHGVNPAYDLPAELGFLSALRKVKTVFSTDNFMTESARQAHWIVPSGFGAENWGDAELVDGVVSIQQPTIMPLYATRSFEETLMAWMKGLKKGSARVQESETFLQYLRSYYQAEVYPKSGRSWGTFDEFWSRFLREGALATGAAPRARGAASAERILRAHSAAPKQARSGYELVLYSTVQLGDGRYANVPWLQELPDPVTKVVWDNYVSVSPATARKEGLVDGQLIELKVGAELVKVPAHVQPGLHDDVLALAVGYGRTHAGNVGDKIGVNAFRLAQVRGEKFVFSGLQVEMKKTKEKTKLAHTQDHHSMEGRQIAVETTKTAFLGNPSSGIHKHKVFSIWPEHQYTKHKWALAVDLNSCTGCSACVIACQSENNIPTVGKRYVLEGREMHWIRIDRYYKGSPESPDAVVQPMMCQHCENAPCETVCPVLATVHNEEGLNDMVYNRCVGTRYCSNNCPYKVRRFNWFNYMKNRPETLNKAYNPDVTVRPRGVMEKCTFCVQRIRHATSKAKVEKRTLEDGDIKTACQQSCPADAITFGDLNNPESQVAKLFKDKRGYGVLEEWNTQPRVRYLSRVRNADRAVAAHGYGHGDEKHDKKSDQAPGKSPEKAKDGHSHGSVGAGAEGKGVEA
jgi:molybdopterin-containing oxidoreductase family iron-sulfur binding subunit